MNESRFVDMVRLRSGLVFAGLVVAAVAFLPSVAGAASVTFGVPGLQLCAPNTATQCDLGPIREHFVDYGNVCSYDDCFFASAADWEKVAAGVTPTITTLDLAYKAAGQTFGGGVSAPDLWTYWKASGIDGVYLESETVINKSEASVENAVKARRALIVNDPHALMIGSEKPDIRLAMMIVDGYTPKGPLVVFQGKTLQMTWLQWNAQVQTVWELAVSKTPPSATPPPPTSTTSPTAALSLSPNSLTSAGGTATLTYSSENATSCTLTSSPAIWTTATETVACNGTYVDTVAPSSTAQKWTFTFMASNSSGVSATQTQTLTEAVATSTAPPQAAVTDANWSGYVLLSNSIITDMSGDWTVPILNCSDTPDGEVASWVGIGGENYSNGSSTGALLQTGVTSDCASGVQQDVGWWYVDPSSAIGEINFTNFPVAPGNEMQASVFESTTGAWETVVTDVNTGLSAYMVTGESWGVGSAGGSTFTVQGSAARISYSGGTTAEWIVEDPGVGTAPGTYYPFANFGSVTFSDMESSVSSWSLTPSETWGIVQNGVLLAAPTSTSTDGFTDTYTGP